MDYEKKYKEALKVAKRKLCFDKAGMVDSFTPNDIYEMFPELKESEDEKIRKVLIDYFKIYKDEECSLKTFYGIPADDILAWLEKQGTRPRYNIGDIICDKLCTTLNKDAQPNMEIVDIKNGMYICDKGSFPVSQQDEYELVGKKIDMKPVESVSNELREASFKHAEKEVKNQTCHGNLKFELAYSFEEGAKWNAAQKPTWSEKHIADVFEKVGLAKIVREQSNDNLTIALQDAMIELSKVTLQPNPTAWSKEDENIKQWIISDIDKLFCLNKKSSSLVGKEIEWLKSLKDRAGCEANCTTTKEWKPSNEQMKELNYAVNAMASSRFARENDCCYNVLKTLRDQLKKL